MTVCITGVVSVQFTVGVTFARTPEYKLCMEGLDDLLVNDDGDDSRCGLKFPPRLLCSEGAAHRRVWL